MSISEANIAQLPSRVFPLTSAAISRLLLLLDAGSDGVELPFDALASSDPAENSTSLLAAALLEEPAGALGKEEEADELHHGRDAGKAQHEPSGRDIHRVNNGISVALLGFSP